MAKGLKRAQMGLLAIAVVVLTAFPLLFIKGDFEGADAQAEDMITELAPDYEPWAQSVFEPPSSEVESLFFTLQAALGAGVMGFIVGKYTERHRQRTPENSPSENP